MSRNQRGSSSPPDTIQLRINRLEKLRNDLATEHEALRGTIREGHELLKDLRQAVSMAQERGEHFLEDKVEELIGGAVRTGLKRYDAAITAAIDKAEQAVYNRFDTTISILLGEEFVSQRGAPPTAELIRRYLLANPRQAHAILGPETIADIIKNYHEGPLAKKAEPT